MKASTGVIAIHYHSPYFRDKNGSAHVTSVIGLWLESLATEWKKVVYLGYETKEQVKMQDYVINNPKVEFISLGEAGGITSIIKRVTRAKKKVKSISNTVDGLLVRAPTPRQGTILGSYSGKNKAIYLVGEPLRKSAANVFLNEGFRGLMVELLNRRRLRQTRKLASGATLISNSMELCRIYEKIKQKTVYYCSSSSIKPEDFYIVEDRCDKPVLNLLFVGRICKAKGIEELLEASALLRKRGDKFRVSILGEAGEGEKLDSLKSYCRENGMDGIVSWEGRVRYGEHLFGFYRNSDMLILPSEHEGFPRVVLEAMANGVIVLVTRVGGLAAECEHGKEVYFVDKSSTSIVNAIDEIRNNPPLRKGIIASGYRFAKDHMMDENERRMTTVLEREWV